MSHSNGVHKSFMIETLEQATKGILALATWPLSGTAAQLDATAAVGSGQAASGKKSVLK